MWDENNAAPVIDGSGILTLPRSLTANVKNWQLRQCQEVYDFNWPGRAKNGKLLEIEIIINFLSIFNNQFHALFVDENALLISSGYWNRSAYFPISVSFFCRWEPISKFRK